MRTIISLLVFLNAFPAFAIRFTGKQNPALMSPGFQYTLNALPLKAKLSREPWSETYWPDQKGSINLRWNQSVPVGFQTQSYSLADLKKLLPTDIIKLSPAEKYDIFRSRYDYPLKNEVARTIANPQADDWVGICDGWAIASIQYAEPEALLVKNKDGISIPFGSSDIKALMSYFAAYHFRVETKEVGVPCVKGGECQGLNAGTLHILLTNLIGLQKKSFVIDRSVTPEIWNQPVFGYDLKIIGSARPQDGVTAVRVQGTMSYTDELDRSQWQPVVGTALQKTVNLWLDYNLDLDGQGKIIGGSYNRKSGLADFAWLPMNALIFTDYYDGINDLYRPVETVRF